MRSFWPIFAVMIVTGCMGRQPRTATPPSEVEPVARRNTVEPLSEYEAMTLALRALGTNETWIWSMPRLTGSVRSISAFRVNDYDGLAILLGTMTILFGDG